MTQDKQQYQCETFLPNPNKLHRLSKAMTYEGGGSEVRSTHKEMADCVNVETFEIESTKNFPQGIV